MPDFKRLPHILVENAVSTEDYEYPPGGGGSEEKLPRRERKPHASHLLGRLQAARTDARLRRKELEAAALPVKKGTHLEFESEPGFDLELKSLENARQGIQLVAVREAGSTELPDGPRTHATVFVPEGKLRNFEKKLLEYAEKDTPKTRRPRHQKLVEKIANIRLATLRSFWTDDETLLPGDDDAICWEVWLRDPEERRLESFERAARALGIEIGERTLTFPSTRVLLAYGNLQQFSQSVDVVDSVAELRRAKAAPSFFLEMPRQEEGEWVQDLAERTAPPSPGAPSICILDTGINAGHPLLRLAVEPSDVQAVNPQWGSEDHQGHGTRMAGLALYGDLTEALAATARIQLPAWLESVKILPPPPGQNHPDLYGAVSEQAVARAEVEKPNQRRRTHLLAVTAVDGRKRGRPSSWSAALDKLAFGSETEPRRLWVVAAGNSQNREAWPTYPDYLASEEIHDPGQAWNVLTVGASTEKWQITESDFDDWTPLAKPGELGPATSTSNTWSSSWPLKPDVVFEGGNAALSPSRQEADLPDSLSLLTTHHRPIERLLTTFDATSASSALAARMAATLQSLYPAYWPETIRALIVHSASWTPGMLQRYEPLANKSQYEALIRSCGFGIPSLERALWSAGNHLTLIAQESFQPYDSRAGSSGQKSTVLNEMQLHDLPWPMDQLRELGETPVELRVTLSYFIEPNPSERGYRYRHRYASHGFRFDVRSATESLEEFRKRLNKAAREEGEKSPGTSDTSGWVLGEKLRHKGSIHSDIWRGTAADVADRHHLAVFPVTGWWYERHNLGRWRNKARYSLVVSIHAPEVELEIDLYTPVANQVGIPIEI